MCNVVILMYLRVKSRSLKDPKIFVLWFMSLVMINTPTKSNIGRKGLTSVSDCTRTDGRTDGHSLRKGRKRPRQEPRARNRGRDRLWRRVAYWLVLPACSASALNHRAQGSFILFSPKQEKKPKLYVKGKKREKKTKRERCESNFLSLFLFLFTSLLNCI